MPIFHDPYDSVQQQSPCRHTSSNARRTAQSPSTRSNTPHMANSRGWSSEELGALSNMNSSLRPKQATLDRVDLIERLKRTKSPVWQQASDSEPSQEHAPQPRPNSGNRATSPSLALVELKTCRTSAPDPFRDLAAAGLDIQRPRSALHSGDFRERKHHGTSEAGTSAASYLATSPVVPWKRSHPVVAFPTQQNDLPSSVDAVYGQEPRPVSRARAISQSSTGSFALLPPTSPLVQAANHTDLDSSSRPGSRCASRSPDRNHRRHTFSPASLQTYQSAPMARSISGTSAARHLRHGSSTPYQAHQPRRPMTFNQPHSMSTPQTPFLSPRRPSFSIEACPLHHAPMVGSYEESILRGRMSTTPSRPLDFVAKIGVLGKGQCKSSLKCPPHVAVPFPAVFYSYNTGNGIISNNEPSPYVGLIDLENSLPAPDESNESSRRKRRHAVPTPDRDDLDFRIACTNNAADSRDTNGDLRKKEKRKRRSTSPKAPPGGSYRIPAQGQLQIVLKNPNNTAVKLFLVPYDLSDMEPGQKTFIRQRSYSAGPIIDMPTQSRKNLGTDRPEAALSNSEDPNDRPILRYLIHLHICCSSKDRYFLYKSIRVVFANRVPDGKEKLRNEIQLPEPKYSTYKPTREAQHPGSMDKPYRRRSTAWQLSQSQQQYNQMDGLTQYTPTPAQFTGGNTSFASPLPHIQPIPFSLSRLAAIESRPVSRDHTDIDKQNLPTSGPTVPGTFEKINKGDVGFSGPSAGLLSQRLKGLEVQRE
ncbi:hypothetical protein ACEQ8H_004253 [Pleosporales sp. CAS-2024a]